MEHHLSIFRPYERNAKHEDQLTRAALIVLKLVPLAHEAFLGLSGCQPLSALSRPRFDMQTEKLVPLGTETGDNEVAELVSVFLGPHENLTEAKEPNLASERRARYDGIIQYGSRLITVIESKLYANASEKQSLDINTSGLVAKESGFVHVRWQDLLDRWWNLTELGILGHAEDEILSDFFDNAEENFGDLLPYTDLGRCGVNEKRILRRLRLILEEATGIPGEITYTGGVVFPSGEVHMPGATVKFPSGQVVAVDRASMWVDGANICLGMWPAELAQQYKRVYSDPKKVEAVIALGKDPDWELNSNFHLAYRFAGPQQRWYPPRHLPGPVYIRQWIDDLHDGCAGGRTRDQIDDPGFRQWLLEHGYANEDDLASLNHWLNEKAPGTKFHIRPSIRVLRTWQLKEAVSRDRKGEFKAEVRKAIDQVLAALDEPQLKAIQPQ